MRKVFTAQNAVFPGFLKQVLEDRGIRCVIRNEHLGSAAGELPVNECWPELWVADNRDAEFARSLIDAALRDGEGRDAWDCPGCRERIEGQFAQCWNCGCLRPPDSSDKPGSA
ncbi:MAG: DUF2007 domain-containing protein [Gammaproteobacteria bacterium]|nr:DUF2007 domain-containing protein [Gammaproteobacteria bacterium]